VHGLTAETADVLIRGLARVGVLRLTRATAPAADQVALRAESLLEDWGTLRGFLDARLRFRDDVIAWGRGGRRAVSLPHGEALDEIRDYPGRNALERGCVDASRREEWRESEKNRTLLYVALPLLLIAVLGWVVTVIKINDARRSAAAARAAAAASRAAAANER